MNIQEMLLKIEDVMRVEVKTYDERVTRYNHIKEIIKEYLGDHYNEENYRPMVVTAKGTPCGKWTMIFHSVHELYLPMLTCQAITQNLEDDSVIKMTLEELKRIRKQAKKDFDPLKAGSAKMAIVIIGSMALDGCFSHEGLTGEIIAETEQKLLRDLVSRIRLNGGKIIHVNRDTVFYVGTEMTFKNAHYEPVKTLLLTPENQYVTFNSYQTGTSLNGIYEGKHHIDKLVELVNTVI